MSFLDDCTTREISDFSGPNLIQDEEDIKDPRGLVAQDVEYPASGSVKTRSGFAPVWTAANPIRSLHNWIQSKTNRLVYFIAAAGTGNVVSRNLSDNSEFTILSSITARGFSIAEAGYRIIMAFFGSDGLTNLPTGTTEARIWDGTFTSGTTNVEKLFPRALLKTEATLSSAEPSTGSITAGVHSIGIGVISYSGGKTPLGPTASDLAWSVDTANIITASGGRNLRITITPTGTWPGWVFELRVAMSNIINPERMFFVPGAVAAVARGSSIAVSITFSISDEALSATGEDVTNAGYFGLMTQSSGGTGPISPFKIIPYNNRMVYFADVFSPDLISTYTALFVSDQMNPHWVTAAYHQITLPEYRKGCTGGVIGGACYVTGPNWTYGYSDNTRLPSQWAAPRTVSPTIGTPFINGVCQGNGYLWVAHSSGLYKFDGGAYPLKPTSYEQTPDWKKINFSAPPDALTVIENPEKRMVYVIAPVGSAQTVANRILVWDYTDGTTPEKVKYCGIWKIKNGAYNIGTATLVYSPTNTIEEIWLSCADAGKVMRQKNIPSDYASDNAGLYDDDTVGIDSKYRLGPLVRVNDAPDQYHGVNVRVRGAGTIHHRVYSLDGTNAVELTTIAATLSPGRRFTRLFNKQNESCSYEIDNAATAGAFFVLTAVKTYFTRWLGMR